MSDSSPPMLAGRYELRRSIGASTVAEVFLAHDRELDRVVAVKMLAADLTRNPEVVDRFRRMSAAAATLHDPRIVSVFDAGEDAGRAFLVMEYVDGTTLADTLRDSPRQDVNRVAAIGEGIAEALAAAQRSGSEHGSLTPRDVLLTRDGSVKVTDFGTAAAGLAGLADAPVTTAIYSAPERLQGNPPDTHSDLYSLGIILHEAVTGAPPFTGPDAISITRHKLEDRPLPPSANAPGVPPAFDAIVERLLAPSLARRYPNATEVSADLRRLRAPVEPTVRVPTVVAPLLSPVATAPEQRSLAGWIVAAVVALLLLVGGLAWFVTNDSDSTAVEQVAVPAVVGQPVLEAQRNIKRAGLVATTVNQVNAQFEAGLVFAQSPTALDMIEKGSEVQLRVSTGPPPTTTTTAVTTTTTSTTSTTTTTTTTVPPPSSTTTP